MNVKTCLDQRLARLSQDRDPFLGIDEMCAQGSSRQLVWWGCLCGWSIWRPAPPPGVDESLAVASGWVFESDDNRRREAYLRSETPEARPCKYLLKAVINSGGTLAMPEQPVEMPTPDLAGRFLKGFVHLLLAQNPPPERCQTAQTFLQLARQTLTEVHAQPAGTVA